MSTAACSNARSSGASSRVRAAHRGRSASRPATRRRHARCRCAHRRPRRPRCIGSAASRARSPGVEGLGRRAARHAGATGSGWSARHRRQARSPGRRSRSRWRRRRRRPRSRRCRAARDGACTARSIVDAPGRLGIEPVEVAVEHQRRGRPASSAAMRSISTSAGRLPYRPPMTYSTSASTSASRANARGRVAVGGRAAAPRPVVGAPSRRPIGSDECAAAARTLPCRAAVAVIGGGDRVVGEGASRSRSRRCSRAARRPPSRIAMPSIWLKSQS